MKNVLLAVDGGGTKTEFVLVDTNGNVLLTKKYNGSNLNNGQEEAIKVLSNGTEDFFEQAKKHDCKIVGAYFGLAGGVNGNNLNFVHDFFKETYFSNIPFYNYGDELNAVNVALQGVNNGIAVIAGTGSNIMLVKDGEMLQNPQVAGWGYLVDEGGCCGYDFGLEAIRAVKRAESGIGEQTSISQKLENMLGNNVFDSLGDLHSGCSQQKIASLTPSVFEAYKEGDKVAQSIVKNQVASLTEKLNYCNKLIGQPEDAVVGVVGGVFQSENNRDVLLNEFKESNLDENLTLQIPLEQQIYGAVLVSAKVAQLEIDNQFKENFNNTYQNPMFNQTPFQS